LGKRGAQLLRTGCPMKPTVTIEIPAASEAFVRQLLALHEELEALALSAPDGTVLEACETAVVQKGRDLNKRILEDAVARRIETAEKRGPRSALVGVAGPKKTAGPARVNS
jgi:hypothetical protein